MIIATLALRVTDPLIIRLPLAVAGCGNGAAIGAAVGAGAGSVFVQGRDDLDLMSGTELRLRASAPKSLSESQ